MTETTKNDTQMIFSPLIEWEASESLGDVRLKTHGGTEPWLLTAIFWRS